MPHTHLPYFTRNAVRLVALVEVLAEEHCEAHRAGATAHACNDMTHHPAPKETAWQASVPSLCHLIFLQPATQFSFTMFF